MTAKKKLNDTNGPRVDRENISKSRTSRPLKPSDLSKPQRPRGGKK